MNPFTTAWGMLRRNRDGALCVIVLVAVAGALAILASASERAFRAASTRAADRFDLLVGAPGSASQLVLTTIYLQPAALDLLPAGTLARLAADPGVAGFAPIAVTDSYRGHVIVATGVQFGSGPGLIEGRVPRDASEALVGAQVDLPLGTRFSPQHGSAAENAIEAQDHALELVVVGRVAPLRSPWDRAIVVPIESAWVMHGLELPRTEGLGPPWPDTRVPAVVVQPRSVGDAYRVRARLRAEGLTALFPAETLVPLYRMLGDARDIVSAMAAAFEVVVLCAVVLAMLASLGAQRPSLAALRALGAPPRFVFSVVWLQAFAVIAAGVVMAIAAGAALLHAVSQYATDRTGLHVQATLGWPELGLLAIPLALGSLLAALAALVVLRKSVGSQLRGS